MRISDNFRCRLINLKEPSQPSLGLEKQTLSVVV